MLSTLSLVAPPDPFDLGQNGTGYCQEQVAQRAQGAVAETARHTNCWRRRRCSSRLRSSSDSWGERQGQSEVTRAKSAAKRCQRRGASDLRLLLLLRLLLVLVVLLLLLKVLLLLRLLLKVLLLRLLLRLLLTVAIELHHKLLLLLLLHHLELLHLLLSLLLRQMLRLERFKGQ